MNELIIATPFENVPFYECYLCSLDCPDPWNNPNKKCPRKGDKREADPPKITPPYPILVQPKFSKTVGLILIDGGYRPHGGRFRHEL
ncbi:hypothetical protein ES705_36406 [subsurface metagenome]